MQFSCRFFRSAIIHIVIIKLATAPRPHPATLWDFVEKIPTVIDCGPGRASDALRLIHRIAFTSRERHPAEQRRRKIDSRDRDRWAAAGEAVAAVGIGTAVVEADNVRLVLSFVHVVFRYS